MDCVMFHCMLREGTHYLFVPKEVIMPYLQSNETLDDFCVAFRHISDKMIVTERFKTFLDKMKKDAKMGVNGVVHVFRWCTWGNVMPGIPKGMNVIEYAAALMPEDTEDM
jgi:hypothetical protein